jgi:3-hydroxyacyl-CoA dehydrogenase
LDAVRAAVEEPLQRGLRLELEYFCELVQTPESKALQYAFFGDRLAASITANTPASPRPIQSVGIVGAGTMGAGIALCTLGANLHTVLLEQSEAQLEGGLERIRSVYEAQTKKGRLSREAMQRRLALLECTVDFERLRGCDLVIEAVYEDLEVKRGIFRRLDAVVNPGTVLASNTSTLDLNQIAAATARPAEVVGLHFFSPANVMRLLEVVRGRDTAPEVLATAMTFARKIRKVGVVAGVCDGFIGNRMFEEYLRQAYFLLDEGVMPWQVDTALESWGMAMGPFAVLDLAGGDVGWAIRKRRALEHPERPYSKVPDRVCELGRFGQKTGAGWYTYNPASRSRQPDPVVEEVVRDYVNEIGRQPREMPAAEIVERCLLALVNEGAKLLSEGIAQRASDIDVVYRNGYGFPPYRGGPMYYADTVGLETVITRMEEFQRGYQGWSWEPAPLLREYARRGASLTSIQGTSA